MATTATSTTSPTRTLRLRHLQPPPGSAPKLSPSQSCKPSSVAPLDLTHVSPVRTLASLRFLVLSHLTDLERHLSKLESPDLEGWKAKGEIKIEEARQWAKTALEMLDGIRSDVRSHLPDMHFSDLASVENFLSAHIPELLDMPTLVDVRSHLPEMPDVRSHLPDMQDVRAHFPDFADMRSKLGDVRTRFQEIDFNKPLSYVPTLATRLHKLHSHLSSMEVEFTRMVGLPLLDPSSLLHEVLDALAPPELVPVITDNKPGFKGKGGDLIENTIPDVARAAKRSLEGMRLIAYDDLPRPWRNNPFVTQGYRYIALLPLPGAYANPNPKIHTTRAMAATNQVRLCST